MSQGQLLKLDRGNRSCAMASLRSRSSAKIEKRGIEKGGSTCACKPGDDNIRCVLCDAKCVQGGADVAAAGDVVNDVRVQ